MAFGEKFSVRSMARIRQIMGITSTTDLANSTPNNITTSVHYGMFSNKELRHVDGVIANPHANQITELDILEQLKSVSSNSKKMIDELDTLTMMAPEISLAETIIISSIISPTDLQTDLVSVQVDSQLISQDARDKINDLLNKYFNDEFKLGPKLVDWLGTAAFHEGAKALMVMPQTEIDVLNQVADVWDPQFRDDWKHLRERVTGSTEGLEIKDKTLLNAAQDALAEIATESLQALTVGSDFMTDDEKKAFEKNTVYTDENGNVKHAVAPTTKAIAKDLVASSFKLLRPTKDGYGVIVTRDLRELNEGYRAATDKVNEFAVEAERQIHGFKRNSTAQSARPQFPVLSISDIIRAKEGDLPIIIEFPTDSVIPVCAPGDNKNHLGYFILINEFGQPIRGEYAFDGTNSADMTHRLATNAARAVFGNQNIQSFQIAGMTDSQIMDNLTKTFSVAVNYLLKTKLGKDGLKGLNINVHEAVGKALFYNLLAKNQIKMVFVPEPMMIYYRFDHREDGTGKSMLENIKFLLAMRCTLMIAKMMAAIDNATKHRVIEVQVDDKNVNPLETVELARQMIISKKAPNITNDPRSAAESIINQHLSIRPKGLPGVADDLSITHETQYGQSQAPSDDLMDQLNNMIGQGIKVPPSLLNNLSETEYSRSVATSNLFFANNVRGWQNMIKPYNKKFLTNYILSSSQLLKEITAIIEKDIAGGTTPHNKDNTSECIQSDQDNRSTELLKKVLSTIELVLAQPSMSTTKTQFEELGAKADAIEKLLNLLYPDDAAPSDDLRSFMSSLRAMQGMKLIKDFLPKLGVHEIAEVPSLEEVETEDMKKLLLFLGNMKARAEHLSKLITGQLATNPEAAANAEPSSPFGGGGGMSGDDGGDKGGDDFPDFGGDLKL